MLHLLAQGYENFFLIAMTACKMSLVNIFSEPLAWMLDFGNILKIFPTNFLR